jgi:hypothetical protein
MLADIYNWFTEGFDTADLIDRRQSPARRIERVDPPFGCAELPA